MTDVEYAKKEKELLTDIPEEFRSRLSYMAYERGHSAGHEEVVGVLCGLVNDLLEPIQKYGARMHSEGKRTCPGPCTG